MRLRKESLNRKLVGIGTTTCAILVQRSTIWAMARYNLIEGWQIVIIRRNIWISYIGSSVWKIKWKKSIAFIDATFAVSKRKPKKIQVFSLFLFFFFEAIYTGSFRVLPEHLVYIPAKILLKRTTTINIEGLEEGPRGCSKSYED